MIINNKDEIVRELTEWLIDDQLNPRGYQRDVYLYVSENGEGKLSYFENIDGMSYAPDNHITIYSTNGRGCYMTETDAGAFEDESVIAEWIDMELDELKRMIAEEEGKDIEDVDYCDIVSYVNENYSEKIHAAYLDVFINGNEWFEEEAERIIQGAI